MRALFLGLIASTALAGGAVSYEPSNFQWQGSDVRPDGKGGCVVTSYFTNDAGLDNPTVTDPFNGPRCGQAETVAFRQLGRVRPALGDGGIP